MRLTVEAKQMIVAKTLNRNGKGIAEIAVSHNVGYSTLQKWIRENREGKLTVNESKITVGELAPAERLAHLIATGSLDEAGLGAYCRERGLYSFQLQEWKKEFMTHSKTPKQHQKSSSELKALKEENARLKQDIKRKDRALSEAAALLILKKKADLIWGDFEDV